MKINELIMKLEEIKETYGNLDVYYADTEGEFLVEKIEVDNCGNVLLSDNWTW